MRKEYRVALITRIFQPLVLQFDVHLANTAAIKFLRCKKTRNQLTV